MGMSQSERYESEVKDLMLRKMSWSYFRKNTVHKQPFFGAWRLQQYNNPSGTLTSILSYAKLKPWHFQQEHRPHFCSSIGVPENHPETSKFEDQKHLWIKTIGFPQILPSNPLILGYSRRRLLGRAPGTQWGVAHRGEDRDQAVGRWVPTRNQGLGLEKRGKTMEFLWFSEQNHPK
jgi:hypothetical protein